jgi:hypothetical protein
MRLFWPLEGYSITGEKRQEASLYSLAPRMKQYQQKYLYNSQYSQL